VNDRGDFDYMIFADRDKERKEVVEGFLKDGSTLVIGLRSARVERYFYRLAYDIYEMSDEIDGILWLCYNATPTKVRERFESYEIPIPENFWCIDMISSMIGLPKDDPQVIYCNTPTDYNCIFLTIDYVIKKIGRVVVAFDDLNAALSYDSPDRLVKVLRNLNNRIPEKGCTSLYLLVEGATTPETENAIQATMNAIFRVGEKIQVSSPTRSIRLKNWFKTWEELENTTWSDVFSFKDPVLYILLLISLVVNVFLMMLLFYVVMQRIGI